MVAQVYHLTSKEIEKSEIAVLTYSTCAVTLTHRHTFINKPCWQNSGIIVPWIR